jgi:repressor LexA
MHALTKRQSEILDVIYQLTQELGMPPTRAELAERMGFRSVNAAVEHLQSLERKGMVELLPNASRGIRLVHSPNELPLIGRVAAGRPMLALQNVDGTYQVDPRLFKPSPTYLLRVYGMSMRDAGILDGDLLAVHRTSEARSGQIVVARVNDEVTVKRWRREGNMVHLLPANPDFEPIRVDPRRQSLVVEGLAVGVIRKKL